MYIQNSTNSLAVEALKAVLQHGSLSEPVRLSLRLCCKELKAEATKTLTRAWFNRACFIPAILPLHLDQFVLRGWPNSLEHLKLSTRLGPADLIALARTPFPKLQTLTLSTEDYKEQRRHDVYDAQIKDLLCMLAFASASWPMLRLLDVNGKINLALATDDIKCLLKGRWSVGDLRLRLANHFDEESIVPEDWSTAFPSVKSLTLNIQHPEPDGLFLDFPESIAQANFQLERLNVCGAALESNGTARLSSAPWVKTIHHLDLHVGDTDFTELMSALEDNTAMTNLSLRYWTDHMSADCRLPSLKNLTHLTIEQHSDDIDFDLPFVPVLHGVHLPKLQYLSLSFYTLPEGQEADFMIEENGMEEMLWGSMPRLRTLHLFVDDEDCALHPAMKTNIKRVLPQLQELMCPAQLLVGLIKTAMLQEEVSREDATVMGRRLCDIYKGSCE